MPLLVEGVYLAGFIKNAPLPGRPEIPAMLIPPQQELWMKHGVFCNTKDRPFQVLLVLGTVSYFTHHRNTSLIKSIAVLLEWLPSDNF